MFSWLCRLLTLAGTDATIATHIKTIQERGYAEKTNNNLFAPTTLGVALVGGYDAMGLDFSKPRLRAEMESDMKDISKTKKNKVSVQPMCLLN